LQEVTRMWVCAGWEYLPSCAVLSSKKKKRAETWVQCTRSCKAWLEALLPQLGLLWRVHPVGSRCTLTGEEGMGRCLPELAFVEGTPIIAGPSTRCLLEFVHLDLLTGLGSGRYLVVVGSGLV
jgi:hypothetical protein